MHSFNLKILFSEVWNEIHGLTGLSPIIFAVICVAIFLFLMFFGGSGKGRGRRYRRGYMIAYREELGKQRAKMRINEELAGEKKPGWRERVKK